MRFRKRMSIARGLRVNLSKSGMSVTAGIPGLSVNVGKRGTYLNTGIPGTGIYNRKRIGGPPVSARSRQQSRHAGSSTTQVAVTIEIDDEGVVHIRDEDGSAITDESILRTIRRDPHYKETVARLSANKQDEITAATDQLVELYKLTPDMIKEETLRHQLEQLTPQVYTMMEFLDPEPDEEAIASELERESREKVRSFAFWKLKGLRAEYVSERLEERMQTAWATWRKKKADHEYAEAQRKHEKDAEYELAYLDRKDLLERTLGGGAAFVEGEREKLLGEITLPLDVSVGFEYDEATKKLMVDLDVPEIEDLPQSRASILKSGKLSVKAKTNKDLQREYAVCVTGLGFYFAGRFFNVSTAIGSVTISGYTQRLNPKTGNLEDEYVYSAVFDRERFSGLNVANIDPAQAVTGFEHRMSTSASFQLKTIVPFGQR